MATPNWKSLEGKLLEGGYEVEECFHSGPSSASFRIRILGDRFTSAYGEFFAPGSVSGAEFALWAETRTLQHPNVSTPLATGQYRLDAQELPYVIRVRPDETLQDTIAERALTTEEAREVVTAVVRALQFLHGNGFVQTTLSPREIVAIGDSIKLSINGIRRINTPIKEMDEPTTAADIRKLGAMTCEILTQRSSEPEIAQAAKTLPSPFNRIVERCVDPDPQKRCSLPDILAMLRGEQLVTPPSPEPARVAPKAMAAVAGAGTIAQTVPRVDVRGASQPRPLAETERVKASQPALPNTARSRPVDHEISAATAPAIRRTWVYAAALAVFVLLVLWAVWPKGSRSTAVSPTAASSVPQQPAQTVAPPPAPSNTATKPVPTHAELTAPAATGKADIWRVVAYTYHREADARKKAELINSKHPELKAEAFSPGASKPYLVVLGGSMTRDEAAKMRQTARAKGMPWDTYIQNYNH